jgi:DinB superfamily
MQIAPSPDIQPAISMLEKTPSILDTLLRDLPRELLEWAPNPNRWSISQVLAHLADIEQVYGDRVRRITVEDSPALSKFEPVSAPGSGEYDQFLPSEHLARVIAMRTEILVLLKSLPSSAGSRIAMHSELGAITLSELLNEWAGHDLGHLRQIAELYRAHAFYPHSGPFQKYSNPKP